MHRDKHRLNKNESQQSLNKDQSRALYLENDSKLLPYNDITRIIKENEVFNQERQASTRYRMISTVNPLLSNPLFNVSGERSWETFNEDLFRDTDYPPNGASIDDEEDFTYLESISAHLREENGWFGYYNPRINESNRFLLNHMKPGREELDILTKTGKNWEITYTYPAERLNNELTENGLDIIGKTQVKVSDKEMVALTVPYKHNLRVGSQVRLTGVGVNGDYEVIRLGMDNGDAKDTCFVIDVKFSEVVFDTPKFKKIVSGVECEYYFRVFKTLKNDKGEVMGSNDVDVYPLAFSKNLFGDVMYQVTTKNDVDIEGVVDNLGRPLTEMYLTFIKKDDNGFSKISSGLLLEEDSFLDTRRDIPDITRIHNGGEIPFKSNTPLKESVKVTDDGFIGDLVEYNKNTLIETTLSEVHHRFNTLNREGGNQIKAVIEKPVPTTIKNSPRVFDKNIKIDGIIDYRDEVIIEKSSSTYFKPALYEPDDMSRTSDSTRLRVIDDGLDEFGTFEYTSISLSYSSSSKDICGDTKKIFYTTDMMYDLATVSSLYRDSRGNYRAIAGYYSDGRFVRYWDGNRFTSMEVCGVTGGNSGDESETPSNSSEDLDLGARQEGYYYKPFHKIQIRDISNYTEKGDPKTDIIPEYAHKLIDGTYVWRDVFDVGQGNVDYPFLNGAHHIYENFILALKRQDPFSKKGLRATGQLGDVRGVELDNKYKIKRSGDAC